MAKDVKCSLDLERVCRVCMCCDEEKMFLIFDEKYAEENTKTLVADMLSELTIYKVQRFDELPHLICGDCMNKAYDSFRFKRKCEKAYRALLSFVNNTQLDAGDFPNSSLISGTNTVKKSEGHTEKGTQTEDVGLYPCERCDEKYFSLDALRLHREQEHKGCAIVCRFCAKSFNRINYLKTHIAIAHPESGHKQYNQCHICKRQFIRRDHMKRHLTVVHKIVATNYETAETKEANMAQSNEFIDLNDYCGGFLQIPVQLEDATPDGRIETVAQLENAEVDVNLKRQKPTPKYGDSNIDQQENFASEHTSVDNSDYGNGASIANNTDDEDERPLAELIDVASIRKPTEDTLGDPLPQVCTLEVVSKESVYTGCENSANFSLMIIDDPTVTSKRSRRRGRPLRNLKNPPHSTVPTDNSTLKKPKYQCDICKEVFPDNTMWQAHASAHDNGQQFTCTVCSNQCTSEEHLKVHMDEQHVVGKKLKCQECDNVFLDVTQFKRHRLTLHSDQMHKCDICKKSFTTKMYLRRHMGLHSKKRYRCKECSQCYLTKDELNAHVKAAGHDKPLLCPECGLRCRSGNILTIHMRRHTGEKPFKCKFCEKGFPRMDDLRIHEKYHTGEKSHFCETCGKGFQRKYSLTLHLRVHTGEKPHKCPHCPQAFAQRNDLKAHIRRHTGERFRCELCGAAFLQGYQMRQHKLSEHDIKEEAPTKRVAKFTSREEQEKQIQQNLKKEIA